MSKKSPSMLDFNDKHIKFKCFYEGKFLYKDSKKKITRSGLKVNLKFKDFISLLPQQFS